ncbi:MAG: CPBP family intramembrane metalloprotease [Candidatus Nanopelagicales bacterium]|nr:CPBP family intramembrane metalloprotease [Candidatus Nanopelagicales bacterium]
MLKAPLTLPPRWGLWDVLITLGGAFGLSIASAFILRGLAVPLAWQILVGGTVPWVALAGWPLFVTSVRGNGARIDLALRLSWREAGWGVVGGLVALIAAAAAAALSAALIGEFPSAAGEIGAELAGLGNGWVLLAFGLMVIVGAPVTEELAFRGLFFAALRKHGEGPVLTVAITAVAFALFHLEPARIGVLICVGVLLGLVRWRTGSLGASMVAHGVVNAPAAVFIILGLPGVTP